MHFRENVPSTLRIQFCSSPLLYQVNREVPTCAPISAEYTLPHRGKGTEDAKECWEKHPWKPNKPLAAISFPQSSLWDTYGQQQKNTILLKFKSLSKFVVAAAPCFLD